jgi:hypothetical protein
MFYRLDSLSIIIRVLLTGAVAYQLIAGVGILAFGEPCELFQIPRHR